MSWLDKLKGGLSKSTAKIGEGINNIFVKRKLDDEALEQLEELLIASDLGVATAAKVVAQFSEMKFEKDVSPEAVKKALAQVIADMLKPVAVPLAPSSRLPFVILMVGVNGNGKTTTIGKLAAQYRAEGKSVMLAAADTFRAAAMQQLQIWGERNQVPVVTGEENGDPAAVAYQALERARAQGVDVLLVDTAGRLQNKANLMAELQKIIKVMKKLDENVPHAVVQVLDATTGQNALSQVKTFKELVEVTGLIVTKLDGTARAGVVVALADAFKLPIYAVGVGEGIEDLRAFSPENFAENLVGLAS
jgi:fused signal recognition particle receptor